MRGPDSPLVEPIQVTPAPAWMARAEIVAKAAGVRLHPSRVLALARRLADLADDVRWERDRAAEGGPLMPREQLRLRNLAIAHLARTYRLIWDFEGGISGGGSTALARMVQAGLVAVAEGLGDSPLGIAFHVEEAVVVCVLREQRRFLRKHVGTARLWRIGPDGFPLGGRRPKLIPPRA